MVAGPDHDLLVGLVERVDGLDRLIASQRADDQRALTIGETLTRQAVDLAAKVLDERLEKVNEFRNALSDAQLTMLPRKEAQVVFDTYVARMDVMSRQVADLGGVLAAMRAQMAGQASGIDDATDRASRVRTVVFGVLAAVTAAAALGLTAVLIVLR